MPLRSHALLPSTASRIIIHVCRRDADGFAGWMRNEYQQKEAEFRDVLEMTELMEGIFDELSFPQNAVEYRLPKKRAKAKAPTRWLSAGEGETNRPAGEVFVLHVQFRQNATWQGTMQYQGDTPPQERRFRSLLELLKMMDAALEQAAPAQEKPAAAGG